MDQVAKALHLGYGDLPEEFTDYIICTELYHCLPSQLDDEDWFTMQDHLAIRAGVNKAQRSRS